MAKTIICRVSGEKVGRGAYSLMSKLPPGDLHVKFDLVESDLCSLWLADTNQGPTLELHSRIEEPVLWL